MTNLTKSVPLTRDALRFCRNAQAVVFRASGIGTDLEHSEIELQLSEEPKMEATLTVASTLTEYNRNGNGCGIATRDKRQNAFEMIHGAQYDGAGWLSLCKVFRAGDVLRLHWVAGNNNGYVQDANLNRDELHLQIFRRKSGKNGGNPRTGSDNFPMFAEFLLSVQVCRDNSARMVRP